MMDSVTLHIVLQWHLSGETICPEGAQSLSEGSILFAAIEPVTKDHLP